MIVAALLVASINCAAAATSGLTGLWESVATSKGGIGQTIEFRRDGTYVEATTIIANFRYRVSGNQLTVTDAPGQTVPVTFGIRVDRHDLTVTDSDGSVIHKQRFGPAARGRPVIVGMWRYEHPTGPTAFERYTEDGRLFFRLPMISEVGCYTFDGDRLSTNQPNAESVTASLTLRRDELIFTNRDGHSITYRRDSAGPWYERASIVMRPQK